MHYFKGEVDRLIAAALDQPVPTPELVAALNDVLVRTRHPARVWGVSERILRELNEQANRPDGPTG